MDDILRLDIVNSNSVIIVKILILCSVWHDIIQDIVLNKIRLFFYYYKQLYKKNLIKMGSYKTNSNFN